MLEPPRLVTFAVSQAFGLLAIIFVILGAFGEKSAFAKANEVLNEYSARFIWHPALMSIGLLYLFGSSAVIYRMLLSMDRLNVKLLHAGIHGSALFVALAGLIIAVQVKNESKAHHFTTLHGLFGVITVILFTTQWAISIPVFLWPKAPVFVRVPGLAVHVCVGIAVFLMATITTFTGLFEKSEFWYKYSHSDGMPPISNYYKTSAFFYLFYVLVILFMVSVKKYERPATEELTT